MNRLKEQAYIVANKKTGKLAEWCSVVATERNAKTRYSYCRNVGQKYPDQTEDVVIQLINPIKLHQMLDDMMGRTPEENHLIRILKEQIDAQ
ncbi:hypothetical protein D3C76_78040 [compost metagenome]